MTTSHDLYRVILEDGTVKLPCTSKAGAAAYVRSWNGLTAPNEMSAMIQPLEESLVRMLFNPARKVKGGAA